eukprot:3060812-Pyramimonas_sp.AAC.1
MMTASRIMSTIAISALAVSVTSGTINSWPRVASVVPGDEYAKTGGFFKETPRGLSFQGSPA